MQFENFLGYPNRILCAYKISSARTVQCRRTLIYTLSHHAYTLPRYSYTQPRGRGSVALRRGVPAYWTILAKRLWGTRPSCRMSRGDLHARAGVVRRVRAGFPRPSLPLTPGQWHRLRYRLDFDMAQFGNAWSAACGFPSIGVACFRYSGLFLWRSHRDPEITRRFPIYRKLAVRLR